MFNKVEVKLNSIYTKFSIKDLENLAGIKAHTIRIWEKRYGILEPHRTGSNIRYYGIQDLQKLLNVVLLYNSGGKISKIARLTNEELQLAVKEQGTGLGENSPFINSFKLSMIKFDQYLFEKTYDELLTKTSFRRIFINIFVPLLCSIGLEWQSDNITPAHEHFISCLIKQKLLLNIEQTQRPHKEKEKVFALYLPLNEVHELGLLYIHYELKLHGYHSIYLGPSVPFDSLKALQSAYKNVRFISYFTVQPAKSDVVDYLEGFREELLQDDNSSLWVLGRNVEGLKLPLSTKKITSFQNIEGLIQKIS